MEPSNSSIYTSGSSSTGHSSRSIASGSSAPTRTERTDTIKPAIRPKTPQTARPPVSAHTSSNTDSSNDTQNTHHSGIGGLRAQIHQLMPRHALFHVRVNIHQLASVPLVKGEFGIRWKFKKVKSHKENGKDKQDKGKGRTDDGHADTDEDDDHDHFDLDEMNGHDHDASSTNGHGNLPLPSLVLNDGQKTISASASAYSTRPASPNLYAQYLSSDWLPQSFLQHSHLHQHPLASPLHPSDSPSKQSLSATTPRDKYAPAKGMTPYLKLQDHNVSFEHTLDVVLQMGVHRDTFDLLPSELKLVVMQRVIPGDIDAPHNPRLGALYLNLAEYAGAGPVTRRYLLSQSKTNATLKLTIELEHVGGETNYKAPPLPKGEILGGIAGILENDVYRTRPRTLDLYGMYYDNNKQEKGSAGGRQRRDSTITNRADPFDISNLSSAYGPKTTETLIEALFNPVPTHSEKESPFTYYVPLDHELKKSPATPAKNLFDISPSPTGSPSTNSRHSRKSSVHSAATSSEYASKPPSTSSRSVHSYSSHGHGEFGQHHDEAEKRSWWRKIGSHHRPVTPSSTT